MAGKHSTNGSTRDGASTGQCVPVVRAWVPIPAPAANAPRDLGQVTKLTSRGCGEDQCSFMDSALRTEPDASQSQRVSASRRHSLLCGLGSRRPQDGRLHPSLDPPPARESQSQEQASGSSWHSPGTAHPSPCIRGTPKHLRLPEWAVLVPAYTPGHLPGRLPGVPSPDFQTPPIWKRFLSSSPPVPPVPLSGHPWL